MQAAYFFIQLMVAQLVKIFSALTKTECNPTSKHLFYWAKVSFTCADFTSLTHFMFFTHATRQNSNEVNGRIP